MMPDRAPRGRNSWICPETAPCAIETPLQPEVLQLLSFVPLCCAVRYGQGLISAPDRMPTLPLLHWAMESLKTEPKWICWVGCSGGCSGHSTVPPKPVRSCAPRPSGWRVGGGCGASPADPDEPMAHLRVEAHPSSRPGRCAAAEDGAEECDQPSPGCPLAGTK